MVTLVSVRKCWIRFVRRGHVHGCNLTQPCQVLIRCQPASSKICKMAQGHVMSKDMLFIYQASVRLDIDVWRNGMVGWIVVRNCSSLFLRRSHVSVLLLIATNLTEIFHQSVRKGMSLIVFVRNRLLKFMRQCQIQDCRVFSHVGCYFPASSSVVKSARCPKVMWFIWICC